MSTSPRSAANDRVFDAILERQAAIFDAIRSGTDRNHRFARSVIEGARQGSRDWAEVSRRLLASTTDATGVYEAISDAMGNSQTRFLALTREWFEDVVESQRESREVLRQGLGDVRQAAERVRENAPNFLRRTISARGGNDAKEPAREN